MARGNVQLHGLLTALTTTKRCSSSVLATARFVCKDYTGPRDTEEDSQGQPHGGKLEARQKRMSSPDGVDEDEDADADGTSHRERLMKRDGRESQK